MKMKTKIILFHVVITALLFSSCKKDTDLFIPDTLSSGLDTNWVAAVTEAGAIVAATAECASAATANDTMV